MGKYLLMRKMKISIEATIKQELQIVLLIYYTEQEGHGNIRKILRQIGYK